LRVDSTYTFIRIAISLSAGITQLLRSKRSRHCETMAIRRRVTFDQKSCIVVYVERPSCKHETKALWYSKMELKRIRIGIRYALKNLKASKADGANRTIVSGSDNDSDDESFQWRGLELVKRGRAAFESKRMLVRGVLNLQKMHKQLGLRDDRTLNLFASAYNKEAVKRAQDAAKQDFVVARQIHDEGNIS
jgi:hypothetical protein